MDNKTENTGKNVSYKHERQDKSKSYKNAFLGSILTSAILLVITIFLFSKRESLNFQMAEIGNLNNGLTDSIAEYENVVNELVSTLNEIELDLSAIHKKEDKLSIQSGDMELTESKREQILNDIQNLNTMLADNKKKVKSLSRQLKTSGIKIAALEDKIKSLEDAVFTRDSSIAELKMMLVENDFIMADLNMTIDSLSSEVNIQSKVISEKETELNTAYLVSGSLQELEAKGLIVKEGGFLGLGKSKAVPTNLPDEFFQRVNINEINKISINAKKTEIISDHPEDSYEIVKNDSLIAYIEIKNPKEFWKITRYAVVETER